MSETEAALRAALRVISPLANWERKWGTLAMVTPPEVPEVLKLLADICITAGGFRGAQEAIHAALTTATEAKEPPLP